MGFAELANKTNNCLTAFQETVTSAMMNSTQMMGDIDKVANLMCRFVPFFYVDIRHLACHPTRCLLPVEIIERCGLATGPASVELLPHVLPY